MIGFVVPFRPKETSLDWTLHQNLLFRTIKSICQQTDRKFLVIIVCTNLPEIRVQDSNVLYLYFPYAYLKSSQIEDYESYGKNYYTPLDAQNAMDQGRKILYGCEEAKRRGCEYIMSVDADDLISPKISQFIASFYKSGIAGWYVDKGYVLLEDKNRLYRQPVKMNELNGSTHIIHHSLIPSPNFNSKKLSDFNFFSAHGWLRFRLKDSENVNLLPFPFFGTLYSINTGSWTYLSKNFEGKGLRKIIKLILRSTTIKKSKILRDFGFYEIKSAN